MTEEHMGIVERLERTKPTGETLPRSGVPVVDWVNPDGPEAAALIKELVEALHEAVRQLRPSASDEERAAYKRGHALLARVRP